MLTGGPNETCFQALFPCHSSHPMLHWSPFPFSSLPDKVTDEAKAEKFLAEYNSSAEVVWNAYTEASWAYNVNITEHNKKIMVWKPAWFECSRITEIEGSGADHTLKQIRLSFFYNRIFPCTTNRVIPTVPETSNVANKLVFQIDFPQCRRHRAFWKCIPLNVPSALGHIRKHGNGKFTSLCQLEQIIKLFKNEFLLEHILNHLEHILNVGAMPQSL